MKMNFKPQQLTITELPKTKFMQVDRQHPIQKIQKNKFISDEQMKLQQISTIYGSAMSMMLRHQRSILSQPERLPSLRSSFLSLQSHLGRLDKLDFQDVLGKDTILNTLNPHQVYLKQFSL